MRTMRLLSVFVLAALACGKKKEPEVAGGADAYCRHMFEERMRFLKGARADRESVFMERCLAAYGELCTSDGAECKDAFARGPNGRLNELLTADRVPPEGNPNERPAPDLAAIGAIDCEKACAGQLACYRKQGLPAANDERQAESLRMCLDGCAMLKSQGDEVKLQVGARLLEYAEGKCD